MEPRIALVFWNSLHFVNSPAPAHSRAFARGRGTDRQFVRVPGATIHGRKTPLETPILRKGSRRPRVQSRFDRNVHSWPKRLTGQDWTFSDRGLAFNIRQNAFFREQAVTNDFVAMGPLRLIENQITCIRAVCPEALLNDRTQLKLHDLLNNILFKTQPCPAPEPPGIALLVDAPNADGEPMSISDLCSAVSGFSVVTTPTIKIGKAVAEAFRTRYGLDVKIPTHPQLVNGRMCQVNHYTHKDHGWIRELIRNFT
jgi:hypothetical protein